MYNGLALTALRQRNLNQQIRITNLESAGWCNSWDGPQYIGERLQKPWHFGCTVRPNEFSWPEILDYRKIQICHFDRMHRDRPFSHSTPKLVTNYNTKLMAANVRRDQQTAKLPYRLMPIIFVRNCAAKLFYTQLEVQGTENTNVAGNFIIFASSPKSIYSPDDEKAATTSSSLWVHNGGQRARSVLTQHHCTCSQEPGRHKWRDPRRIYIHVVVIRYCVVKHWPLVGCGRSLLLKPHGAR
jgi:hypothetical protein